MKSEKAGPAKSTLREGPEKKLIVFSDLDGTLLDKDDYSFEMAESALRSLKERNIPLIFCSSKTRAEIEIYRARLGFYDPFIVENGGAIYIPKEYFAFPFDFDRITDDYLVINLGIPYEALLKTLSIIKGKTEAQIRGFSDMTKEEVASKCGLSLDQASLAMQREFDEPFIISDEGEIPRLDGGGEVSVNRGDRFFHLSGSDKGRAVSCLSKLFNRTNPQAVTVGIGNGQNDFPMLAEVDIPILLLNDDENRHEKEYPPHLRLVRDAGPRGWNSALKSIL